MVTLRLLRRLDINNTIGLSVYAHYYTNEVIEHSIKTRGQSNLTKSASRGPIPRLGVTPGVESCTIEFLG